MAEEKAAMGRTNYAILAMGLASLLVLSLLMKQFLDKADQKRAGPLVHELSATFGGRLDRESKVVLEKTQEGARTRGGVLARVTIYPMMGTSIPKLAQEVGDYVWRRIGDEKQLTDVKVLCLSLTDKQPREFSVARPYVTNAPAGPPGAKTARPRAGTSAPGDAKKGTPANPGAPPPDRGGR